MEKYTKWRDPATGIQPFLPSKSSNREDLFMHGIGHNFFGVIIGSVRCLVVFILTFLLCFFDACLVQILPHKTSRKYVRRIVFFVFCRAILFFMGFWWISSKWSRLRKGSYKKAKWSPGYCWKSTQMIVSNHSSYLDIIYYGFRYAPQYTEIVVYGSNDRETVLVRPVSFLRALLNTIYMPIRLERELRNFFKFEDLIKNLDQFEGPLLLFPEATTSNGKAILKCVPLFTDIRVPPSVHIQVVGIYYSPDEWFVPTYTVGHPLIHLFKICCEIKHSMTVYYLSTDDDISFSEKHEDLTIQISHALSQMLKLRKTNLSVQDKRRFVDYYNSVQRSGYIPIGRSEE